MQHLYKRGLIFVAALLVISFSVAAQNQEQFKARLSMVPPLTPLRADAVVGSGSATAVLSGKKLTINGSFDLTTEQVDALKKGRIYVQLHSEGAPNGHLMGWLLTDAKK